MSTKVMVIDNNVSMRGYLANALEKSVDLLVIDEDNMNHGTMNHIKLVEPGIVLLNFVLSEYEAAMTYVRLLIDDSSVKFLTLSRYENRYCMLALFNSPATGTENDAILASRVLALVEETSGWDVKQSSGASGSTGKYILKGVSLQCA